MLPDAADGSLIYNSTYYWRVRVYNQGVASGWYYGGTSLNSPGLSFKTALHPYPYANFPDPSPVVLTGAIGNVSFTDSSTCYKNVSNVISPYSCNTLTSETCTAADSTNNSNCYMWNFGDPSGSQNVVYTIGNVINPYTRQGTYSPSLRVCDDIGCCPYTGTAEVKTPSNLPQWKEISPF